MNVTTAKNSKLIAPIKDWTTLREAAADGYRDAVECRSLIDIYQSGQDVFLALNSSPAAPAFNGLCLALSYRLQLLVVRAYGDVRREDDRNLHAVIMFLQADSRLVNVANNSNRSLVEGAIRRFGFARKDSRLPRLKKMRDKKVAHIAVYEYGPDSPTYQELFEFAEVTIEIWKDLASGLNAIPANLGTSMEGSEAAAKAFWKHWAKP